MNSLRNSIAAISVLFLTTLIGCQSSPDFDALKSEILDLHQKSIEAHWNKDVDFLVENLSEGFVSVGSGEIRRPTKEEVRSQFRDYLNNTAFSEYADLREPIVGFSNDGSVAWSIVQVKVAGERMMDDGSTRAFSTIWAWITLYERQGDGWIRTGEVSNYRPSSD